MLSNFGVFLLQLQKKQFRFVSRLEWYSYNRRVHINFGNIKRLLCLFRGIRSSHVLVCSSGKVCLTGLRSAASLHHQGKRQRCLHALPPVDNNNMSLLWLSPELLEQVFSLIELGRPLLNRF